MKVLGVTGGIGMGKSTCAALLREMGVAVVDTDDLARELVEPGQPALGEILAAFGQEVLDPSGSLRRGELARKVFASKSNRRMLEGILHPRIRERWRGAINGWRDEGKAVAAVIIPLLFETQAERELDAVICVACSDRTQQERLAARGWTPAQVRERINAQLPVSDKIARANFVIWSEGSLQLHKAQLTKVLNSKPLSS